MVDGCNAQALGTCSEAEGCNTLAVGDCSHAEGRETTASGISAHAEGSSTIASGVSYHTEGIGTCANGLDGVHVMGQLGGPNPAVDLPFSWYLVNGAAICDTTAVVTKILSNGSACFDSTVTASAYITAAGACDYAEMFEISGEELINVGYFVTFDGESDQIRKANASDTYILGVTSSNPGVLADTENPECSKYLLDDWNRPIYEEVTIAAVTDSEGKVIMEERKEMRKKMNPEWDPDKKCNSRITCPDWVAVGLLGKLLVRDDGTCKAGGYCRPNDEGIATAASEGYRVMKRTGENQILILFR
ncbi:MAG: peptidase G2 autoproteolytic cleavage domain-containing protein [Bacillota bacterium]